LYKLISGCRSLAVIRIPKGVTWIGGLAFSDCSSLDTVYVGERFPYHAAFRGLTILPLSFIRFADADIVIKDLGGNTWTASKDSALFKSYRTWVEKISAGVEPIRFCVV
jgi:hypothetical protein